MYDRVGGDAFFERLTRRFYDDVTADPVLRPLYPDDPADLEASRRWLRGFLVQYWGGPRTYSDERGHPRLRMRHAPFAIGQAEREAWMGHMAAAVRAEGLSPLDESQMLTYFDAASTAMINQPPAGA